MKEVKVEELFDLKKINKLAIIDVRSPKEYEEDHIIGAINIPIFEDDERALVGTIYKNKGRENAIKVGIDITAPKLKAFNKRFKEISTEYKHIVVYCFRGGMRSGAISKYITSQGIDVYKLSGGYKSYRRYVIDFIDSIPEKFKCIVLHGNTGVGKTDFLNSLSKDGFSVLDLEKYAKNSGSVYGEIYYEEGKQTQKKFESLIFKHLFENGDRYVFLESESKKIGRVYIPKTLFDAMGKGYHIYVESSIKNRVNRLVDHYSNLESADDKKLINATLMLKDSLGKKTVEELIDKINIKDYKSIAKYLIENYYDNLYKHSIDKYSYEFTISSDEYDDSLGKLKKFYKCLKGENYEK